jgi:hypothetical protein
MDLHKHEEMVQNDLAKIRGEIRALEAKSTAKERECDQLNKRKRDALEGMSVAEAFALGRELGLGDAQKRAKRA